MSYSTRVYLHGYCSSFIIILLVSSLSYVWLSSQLFLSHFITTLSFSHLNSAKPISFSFFFKISGFEDEDDDSSAEVSRATDWVWSASLGDEWVGNADQPFQSNNPFGNEDGDGELIGHGEWVGQSCCDCDRCCCNCCCGRSVNQWSDFVVVEDWWIIVVIVVVVIVVVVIVVVEDRWINGRILLKGC